jgi:hypothetical protein
MKKRLLLPALLILSFVSVCLAADVDGKWTGLIAEQYEFNIKVAAKGDSLTGVAYVTGTPEIKIENGIIKGNEITFTINSPQYGIIPYTGIVEGDKMTLTLNVGGNILNTEMARVKE